MGGILVTGISGFIGGHVWARLAAQRDDIWGVHGASGSVPLRPERQVGVDLAQPGGIEAVIDEHRPAVILHLAAISRPEMCRRHGLLAWRINNAATRRISAAAAATGSRMVFASSDQVFEGGRGNYREGDPAEPINIYGETKKAAEKAVFANVPDSVVVRLNNTYGPPRFKGGSFSEWILQRDARSDTIPLFTDQYRSFLDIVTATEALVELIDNPFRGLLHVGGRNRVNRVTFGRMLLQHLGRDTTGILDMPTRKFDPEGVMPLDTSFDITLAQQTLDVEIPNVMEGLRLAYGPPRGHYR